MEILIATLPFQVYQRTEASDWYNPKSNQYLILWKAKPDCDSSGNEYTDEISCLHSSQYDLIGSDAVPADYVVAFDHDFLQLPRENTFWNFYSELFNLYNVTTLHVGSNERQSLITLVDSMVKENSSYQGNGTQEEVLKALLKIFLVRLHGQQDKVVRSRHSKEEIKLAKDYLELIQQHYLQLKKVSDYAERLRISPNYLNTKIKRVTGFNACYHIQQRIVSEAKHQARWQGMCMKEIAYFLGFEDHAHFSKFFKNVTGINFTTFVKSIRYGKELAA